MLVFAGGVWGTSWAEGGEGAVSKGTHTLQVRHKLAMSMIVRVPLTSWLLASSTCFLSVLIDLCRNTTSELEGTIVCGEPNVISVLAGS